MKIKVPLRKILNDQFRPVLKAVMEKWPEAKDILTMVKIAAAIEAEMKAWGDTVKKLTEDHGYEIAPGRKSANPEEITNAILQEHGKVLPDGNLTISGATDEDMQDFFDKKEAADTQIRAFNKAVSEALDCEIEIEIPRLVKVTDKLIRKSVINGNECFVISPILDLSAIEGDAPAKEEEKD